MAKQEYFNQSQKDSEDLARIAAEYTTKTHTDEVEVIDGMAGVIKDGIFYTGTTDGVGTKAKIAEKLGFNSYFELGLDLFNSNVNDLLRGGVEPKFSLVTVSLASKKTREFKNLMEGVAVNSKHYNIPIIGGETEVLRGVFENENTINVGLSLFGEQKVEKLIIGKDITTGDIILGLPSSGLHTNGFTEIVERFNELDLDLYLSYWRYNYHGVVKDLLRKATYNYLEQFRIFWDNNVKIKAAEAVTGGGFTSRLNKMLENSGFSAEIDSESWPKITIFKYLQEKFGRSDEEMDKSFNMGIGMFLVVNKEERDRIFELLRSRFEVYQIGEIISAGRLPPKRDGAPLI